MKTKMQIAQEAYTKANGDRRTFMDEMINIGMTKGGAATYYQNLKNQNLGGMLAPIKRLPQPTTPMGLPTPVTQSGASTTPILTTPGLNEPRSVMLVIEASALASGAFGTGKIVVDTLNKMLVNNTKLLSASTTSGATVRATVLVLEIQAEITMGAFKAGKQAIESLNRMLGDGVTKLLSASEKY